MSAGPSDATHGSGGQYPTREQLAAAFAFTRRAQMPHIPDVVLSLRTELAKPYPDARRVADLITQDPALAGNLLKSVNSAALGHGVRIDSVHQAVVRLGLRQVAQLVTAESLQMLTGDGGAEVQRVWESMREEAAMAVRIARHTSGVDLEEVYLFGMMHDVGHILFTRMDPGFSDLRDAAGVMPLTVLNHERRRVGVDHTTLGFLFARHWDLPDYFALAVYHHHGLCCATFDDPRTRTLIAIIQLAGYLTSQHLRDLELPEMIQYRVAAQRELLLPQDAWDELRNEALNGVLEQT